MGCFGYIAEVVDDIVDSLDDEYEHTANVAAARVKFEKLKWYVGRMWPNKYREAKLSNDGRTP